MRAGTGQINGKGLSARAGGPTLRVRTRVRQLLCLTLLIVPVMAWSQTPRPSANQNPAELTRERQELREQLEKLRRDIAAREDDRDEARDALRDSEQAISVANRRLRDLAEQQTQLRRRISELDRRVKAQEAVISTRQEELARLLRQNYASGNLSPWRALLSGEDPHELGRDLAYLGYVSQARTALIRDLEKERKALADLQGEARGQQAELADVLAQEQNTRRELEQQRAARQSVLQSISRDLQAQQRRAVTLARDEQRLGRVIEELNRVIAQRQAEQRRREQREREQQTARREGGGSAAPPASQPRDRITGRNTEVPDGATGGNFARLKGQLRLPVRGDVIGRFGANRSGGGTWKGIFIRADNGSDVRAVADGKVVFSEWLRGFGNLLIIDHGNQYLSIYGNNESLLKQAGDAVRGGDTIAQVGATGGQPESGLYFELRHRGQPLDPLGWARLR